MVVDGRWLFIQFPLLITMIFLDFGAKSDNHIMNKMVLFKYIAHVCAHINANCKSESELFTGDTSKDNHSPGPVIRGVSP